MYPRKGPRFSAKPYNTGQHQNVRRPETMVARKPTTNRLKFSPLIESRHHKRESLPCSPLTSPRNSWSCTKRSPSASPSPPKPGDTTPTAPGPQSGAPPRNSISRQPAKVKVPPRSTAGGIPPGAPRAPLPPLCGPPVEVVELVPAAPPGEARSRRSSRSLTASPVARVPVWPSAAAAGGARLGLRTRGKWPRGSETMEWNVMVCMTRGK